MNQVVITGIGIITPIGIGVNEFWKNALNGKSGIRAVNEINLLNYRSRIAGICDNFKEEDWFDPIEIKYLSRATKYALVATKLCINDSGLDIFNIDRNNFGCYIGTSYGGLREIGNYLYDFWKNDLARRDILILTKSMENAIAANIAIKYKLHGPNITVNTACTSGANAIALAYNAIKQGEIEMAFAGGSDAISLSEPFFEAWNNTRILSTYNENPTMACRPFAKSRNGTVISEGCAILLLESKEHAIKRKAKKIYAEIIGYSTNCDADNLLSPNKDIIKEALKSAIEKSKIKITDINYINSHGTGTIINDKLETEVIKDIFGEYAYFIPINSTKSLVGHSMGASGAIEASVVALSIYNGMIHPTINLIDRDPYCDLDYVSEGKRRVDINYAISNSFGMGGNNTFIVFKKHNIGKED